MRTQSSLLTAFQTSEARRGSAIGLASQSTVASRAHFSRSALLFAAVSTVRAVWVRSTVASTTNTLSVTSWFANTMLSELGVRSMW